MERRSVVIVSLLLAGCSAMSSGGSGSAYGSGDPTLAAPNLANGPPSPFLADGRAVLRALDAIEARSGRPLRVVSMNSDRATGLVVEVQEPYEHVDVDSYTVAPDGTLSGPAPVKLVSLGSGGNAPVTAAEVDLEAFDPRTVGFERLARTVHEAIVKSGFPDARVSEWQFDGIHPDDRRYLYLEAARARPVATLRRDMTLAKMQFS